MLRAIFSPNGELIATASNDVVRIWRTRDGRLLHTLKGHKGVVLDVAFSPDGKRIASGGDRSDRTARIWGVDGTALHVLRHRGPVVRVTFSPDGSTLATASGDEMARLWRVDSGRLQKTLRGHTDFVRDVEFRRPDGKVVVTASDDGDARTWDVATGKLLEVFRGHFSSVQAASFSPNGHWIVTAGPRTAGLWDAETGQFFPPTGLVADPFLRGPARGPVTTAEFTPDGKRIVTASGDGTVRTYFCTACWPDSSLATARAESPRGPGARAHGGRETPVPARLDGLAACGRPTRSRRPNARSAGPILRRRWGVCKIWLAA